MAVLKHEENTRDFTFQGICRWPVINFVTLIHGYSHLISLEFVAGYWKFSRNLDQFKWVTKEARYHVPIAEVLKRNLMSQIAELFRRPRIMLKIHYFSGYQKFFQKSPGIKFLYDRGRILFHSLSKHFQQNYYQLEKPLGHTITGHLDKAYKYRVILFNGSFFEKMFYIKTTVLKNLAIFSGKQNVENVALLLFCSNRNGLSLTVNKE